MVITSNLSAETRESVGKGKSRSLRREGKIPAIIYGNKLEPIAISISERDLNAELRKEGFYNRLCDLELGKEKIRVLPQEIALHPVSDKTTHIDFLRVSENTKVTIEVPVKFENEEECPGIKKGGILNIVRYNIEVSCPASNIPEFFIIDLTGLELGDSIHFSSIQNIADGVAPTITDRDFTIASVVAPAALTSEEEEAEAEEGVEEGEVEEGEETTAEGETPTEEKSSEKGDKKEK